ncbi:hypothetical protein DSLASN_26050 [Desulfoluna limicola]|uniref:Uncharacterized protein n=2 Tax=Desulfoluna limicola TaxID=2810562 RepID=A0ABM7PIH5_9BACT|nr:hypothetical protein DSLASN_26050 [Desulfoluna limicola]
MSFVEAGFVYGVDGRWLPRRLLNLGWVEGRWGPISTIKHLDLQTKDRYRVYVLQGCVNISASPLSFPGGAMERVCFKTAIGILDAEVRKEL